MATPTDQLEGGRDAVARRAWREALDLLSRADATDPLQPADLEGLGTAAWWIGKLGVCIEARERAYADYQRAGERIAAARVALELCSDYGMKGEGAIAQGWYRRAERLLEGQPESPEHGYLERRTASFFISDDPETALAHARACEEIGNRLGDPNLQALGLHEQGRALIQQGKVEEGLAILDEAMVAAISGELDPGPTGTIYCNAINVCQELTDYRRAGEWTDAAKRWCDRQAITGFPGICRVRRAEITRLRGGWAEAEREARLAFDELREFYVEIAAESIYEIGEIRLRMGDLAAAEEAFRQAHEMGREPQPGMAMVRLAEGNVAAAATAVGRALAEDGGDPLAQIRLLPARVAISVEAGDLEAARAAFEQMEGLTRTYDTTALRAATEIARGRLLLAEGDPEDAAKAFRTGGRLWQKLDAPYEAAEGRMLLALAYRGQGDSEAAALELEAARSAFERLGAASHIGRIDELLDASGAPHRAAAERVGRTFMFTDIVGSTNLVEAIGDDAWGDLQRWHDETLRSCFSSHGGEEVDHAGDGFFVAFPDPASAIECAVSIQRSLADHRKAHGFSPQVRVGLHAAEAAAAAGGYRGRGVHEAARIGSLASGDEIVASASTVSGPLRFPVSDPRAVELKGIAEPVEVVSIDWRA